MPDNVLYYGDNLDILRRYVKDETVDLVYLDPPFNSNATYNVLFAEQNGTKAAGQVKAFEDTWKWDPSAAKAYHETVEAGGKVSQFLQAFHTLLGNSNMLAYLAMMAPRLMELRRVLKPTGSIYLHCDPTASHYLKLLMDAVFGPENFRNEVIWQRTNTHNDAGQFGRIHDTILFYVRSPNYTWRVTTTDYSQEQLSRYKADENGRLYTGQDLTASRPDSDSGKFNWRGTMPPSSRGWGYKIEQLEQWWADGRILTKQDGTPRMDGLKKYLDEMHGKPLQSIWADIPRIANTSPERLGYATQKPVALLERILQSSSNPGDLVLDPFCGCGTTIAVAQRLSRRWIGIDVTQAAVVTIKKRLADTFPEGAQYQVIGEPTSLPDARVLAEQNPYQFQWWALGLVGARPAEQKKGSDKGIDGRLYFHDEAEGGKTKQVILSVKAGHTGVAHVHELRGVIEREGAQIGVLITLQEPTKPMSVDAASGGFYHSPGWNKEYPRLQILTVADLLAGKGIDMPPLGQVSVTFKKAPKAKATAETVPLPFGQ